jgi:hypothetical protein
MRGFHLILPHAGGVFGRHFDCEHWQADACGNVRLFVGPITLLIATVLCLWFCYRTDYEKDIFGGEGMGADEMALLMTLDGEDEGAAQAAANLKMMIAQQMRVQERNKIELDVMREEISRDLKDQLCQSQSGSVSRTETGTTKRQESEEGGPVKLDVFEAIMAHA